MLRRDVVEALAAGQFQIYAVETIDRCMEVLTGLDARQRGVCDSTSTGPVI
ncbi:MAG: hypothetical protein AAF921_18180 [Cyanobacteria bacterium P01_D01_bin.44]